MSTLTNTPDTSPSDTAKLESIFQYACSIQNQMIFIYSAKLNYLNYYYNVTFRNANLS